MTKKLLGLVLFLVAGCNNHPVDINSIMSSITLDPACESSGICTGDISGIGSGPFYDINRADSANPHFWVTALDGTKLVVLDWSNTDGSQGMFGWTDAAWSNAVATADPVSSAAYDNPFASAVATNDVQLTSAFLGVFGRSSNSGIAGDSQLMIDLLSDMQ
jgi:hypothetical protein